MVAIDEKAPSSLYRLDIQGDGHFIANQNAACLERGVSVDVYLVEPIDKRALSP
jgi:hypothetical protein